MIETIELRFRAGDASLAGTLTLPEAAGRRPWAVLVPSWLPRDRSGGWDRIRHASWFAPPSAAAGAGVFERLAEALGQRGIASLRYDPRGCGESDGSWEETALFTRIDDVRDAVGAMRSRPELDLRRTAVIGHGEGAGIAMTVAIGDPAIGAVGLIGPSARSLRTVLRAGVAARGRTGVDREHPIVAALDGSSEELIERAERREAELVLMVGDDSAILALGDWEQGFHTPPLALATMLHRNVAMVHGAEDAWTPVEESRILDGVLRDAGNEPWSQVVDGVGHDLAGAPDEVIAGFADALAARMEPRELPPVLIAIEGMSGGQ